MTKVKTIFTAAALSWAILPAAYANDIRYTVIDLGTLGGPVSAAYAISQNGIVVGGSQVSLSAGHPFIYQGGGPMQDIGLLDPVNGRSGGAYSVNSKGQVVGESDAAGAEGATGEHAFYYSGSGPLVDLGTLGGQSSWAYGINESGMIAGAAQDASGTWDGVIWTVAGRTVNSLVLGPTFVPTAINNTGLLGGVDEAKSEAAVYSITSGSMTDIPIPGATWAQVQAMSDTGLAVGWFGTGTTTHGFIYNVSSGVLTDLYFGPGTSAAGVNDLGQVVGGVGDQPPTYAFIYSQAGGMQNLNDLIDPSSGWDIWAATGINDAGWICGQGVNPQGRIDAVLLVPLPEPSSLSLVTIVFAIVAGWFAVARFRAKEPGRF